MVDPEKWQGAIFQGQLIRLNEHFYLYLAGVVERQIKSVYVTRSYVLLHTLLRIYIPTHCDF